jgi:outer membrane protein insertion porin family
VSLRLENVDFRDFANIPTTPQLYRDVAGDNFLSTVQFRINHDTRDSAFLPSAGHFVELAYEQAFGEFNYPRVDLTGSQFFRLWERPDGSGKHILMLRGETTWTGDDTPVFERLYAGGFQSFRGFEFRGVTPRQNGFRIGGQFLALATAEYQFPITAGDAIRGVLFTDVGTVDTDVSFDEFRATAGFGFRLYIPAMGPAPLAFDFAFPILSEALDSEEVFSFYIGTTF